MRSIPIRKNRWLHGLVTLGLIAAIAVALWNRPSASTVLGQTQGKTQAALKNEEHAGKDRVAGSRAEDIAAEFRNAAREALPGMVSIETQGRRAMQGQNGTDEGRNPFGDDALRQQFRDRHRESELRVLGHASGFVIDRRGVILTSNHVIAQADHVKVKFSDGREFVAADFKGDPRTDVAIVRISPEKDLPVLKLGESEAIEIGDWVLAVGSPFGLDLSVTAGIISAKGRGPGITEREDFLQTDAAINPGNSGGPLVNLHGEVVGVNSAIATRSGGYEGIGFAVPINLARWVADQLMAHGRVTRAYLGIGVQAVDQEMARHFKVAVGAGVIVTHVVPGSPAAAAKLEIGDVIQRVAGTSIHSPRELTVMIERLQLGHKYELDIQRNGKELKLEAVLKELPEESRPGRPENKLGRKSESEGKFGDLGIEVGELNPEIARQLGYRDSAGVAILGIVPGSPAAEAGLQPGMMIDQVGQHHVATVAELQAALKGLSLEHGVLLLVRTPAGRQFVVLRNGN